MKNKKIFFLRNYTVSSMQDKLSIDDLLLNGLYY